MDYDVTRLAGYTAPEQEMNSRLNELFAEWHDRLKRGSAGRFDPAWFVTDGFYPRYTEQKVKILFLGREAYGLAGHSYIDTMYGWYKNRMIGEKDQGGQPLNRDKFHSRMFYHAYGLNHGCPPWNEIPYAADMAETFALPGGLSFAFMNFSKISNETDSWKLNWPAAAAFLECCLGTKTNFFNREIDILQPDIIIAMNFPGDWLAALGQNKTLEPVRSLWRYLLKVGGREIPLINSYHFSAFTKTDRENFYDPIVESFKKFKEGGL